MRKYSYQVEGTVTVSRMGPLCDALCQIPLIDKASIHLDDHQERCILTLIYKSDFSGRELEDVESLVAACLGKEGLTLVRPALANTYVTAPEPKAAKTVPLAAAVGAMITAVLLAVLCTFAFMTMNARKKAADTVIPDDDSEIIESDFIGVDVLDLLFSELSVYEMDREAVIRAVLDAYVVATGDPYAEYYSSEEYQDIIDDQKGEMCGIGVQVINGLLNVEGVEYQAIQVANVYADSPAAEAGVQPGDYIMYVGLGDNAVMVHNVGYTKALDLLSGEEGTACEFIVYRPSVGDGENVTYETLEISAVRRKLTVQSVTSTPCDTDATVGIIRIIEFDDTTPSQLTQAVESLQAQGCTSFVLDLRGNPGGLLTSVIDVLTFFLDEGDVILTTKDKRGIVTTYQVGEPTEKGFVASGSGTLKAQEIGKYRDLVFTVLVNEYSASAAELFTSNIRDYELGKIVGTTTYGKGVGQTSYDLFQYGYEGFLKLTTFYYYPPCGEGYDGIGIVPHVEVELSEEAQSYNINILPHDKDNQLQAAIEQLKN